MNNPLPPAERLQGCDVSLVCDEQPGNNEAALIAVLARILARVCVQPVPDTLTITPSHTYAEAA